MELTQTLTFSDVKQEYSSFCLNIPRLNIPIGLSTALIGENGAGKTTLLNILKKKIDNNGFVSSTNYFNSNWSLNSVANISPLLFDSFDKEAFKKLCYSLELLDLKQKITTFSDGMKMKAMLAATLSRETDVLLLDEPASPLDPVSREGICKLMKDYLDRGNGKKTILFSTHNISDMENATDYAIIMANGKIIVEGFVEDLKEKYLLVKGEANDADALSKILFGFSKNSYGCTGLCEASDLDKLAGFDIEVETPTLSLLSVGIIKRNGG